MKIYNMKFRIMQLLILLFFSGSSHIASAQSYTDVYFQQRTDFEIAVSLDTVLNSIEIDGQLTYHNNSPDELGSIYFHVWWNAFSSRSTAFAEQRLTMGMRDFYFADEEALGGHDDLTFKIDGEDLVMKPYVIEGKLHPDIIEVELKEPLKAGDKITISFSSEAKIPYAYSRPGLRDELFRMTQWFPKPAVYDSKGWHQMPYLDLGEFFAEYGDYRVTIDTPESHGLVSTGTVVSESSEGGRTQTIIEATNVPDFAWFSSDIFTRHQSTVSILGKEIPIVLFTDNDAHKDRLLSFMSSSLQFYSEQIGAYPYPQYTLVMNEDDLGGGMEYPMISMIDMYYSAQKTDNLIAHEVGHNWFQSVIGTNERAYPWLDEGINSFYERKYNDSKYEQANYDGSLPSFLGSIGGEYSLLQTGVCHLHCCGKLRPISKTGEVDGSSTDLLTYGSNSYERMAMSLRYLEGYLGEDVFAEGMRSFFKDWSHMHPGPEDLKRSMENASNKDLSWFFEDLIIHDQRNDFKLAKAIPQGNLIEVYVENKFKSTTPFHINGYNKEDSILYEAWVEPAGETVSFSIPDLEYDKLSLNGRLPLLDMKRRNNHLFLDKTIGKRASMNWRFLDIISDSDKRVVSWYPSLSYNTYDGLMLGVGLFNPIMPYRDIRWYMQPAYGFASKTITGIFSVEKDFVTPTSSALQKWTLGLSGRRFSSDHIDPIEELEEQHLTYNKLQPSVTLHFQSGFLEHSNLSYKLHYISQQEPVFSVGNASSNRETFVHQLNYEKVKQKGLSLRRSLVQLEYESYENVFQEAHNYLKLSMEHSRRIYYNENNKWDIRIFAGYFPVNSQRESANYSDGITRGSFTLTQEGYTDHTYEGFFFARTDQDLRFSRQVMDEEGGFKMPVGSAYRFSLSNDYMVTANLKFDLPLGQGLLKIRPYCDVAYFSNKTFLSDPLEGNVIYSGGLALEFADFAGLYFPLLYSDVYDSALAGRNFASRVSMKFDLRKLSPWRLSDDPGILIR